MASNSRQNQSPNTLFLPLLAALLTLVVFFPFSVLDLDIHHDGVMLKPALDIWSGQVMFRDTFNQYGALTTYLHALSMEIFGPRLFSIRVATVIGYMVTIFFLVLTWRLILPLSLVVLSVLLWIVLAPFYHVSVHFHPWSSVFAMAFQAITLYFLALSVVRARNGRKNRWITAYVFMAGVMASLTLLCRTPVGVFLFLALLASQVLIAWSSGMSFKEILRLRIVPCVLGFLAPVVLFLGYLCTEDALRPWFEQTLLWPLLWSKTKGTSLYHIVAKLLLGFDDPLWSILETFTGLKFLLFFFSLMVTFLFCQTGRKRKAFVSGIVSAGILGYFLIFDRRPLFAWAGWALAIPLLILGASAHVLWTNAVSLRARKLGLVRVQLPLAMSLIALASWLQYYPVPCIRHTYWALSPAFGIFVYWLFQILKRDLRATFVTICLPLAFVVFINARFGIAKLQQPYRDVEVPVLSGIHLPVELASKLGPVVERIDGLVRKSAPARPILVQGSDAFYACLSPNLKNASAYYVDWRDFYLNADLEARKSQFISEDRPLIIVQTGVKERDPSQATTRALLSSKGYSPLFESTELQLSLWELVK